jgi:HD-like signal output (HDOD) protein
MLDESAFTAGLLHDLGRILLLLADPECFARAGGMDFQEAPGVLLSERMAIGIDHCALGGWFGEHSNLPDTVIQAMRFHHDPTSPGAAGKLVALVATADHVANHLQRGESIETYSAQENAGLALLWEQWPPARKERLLGELPTMMEESLQAAGREQNAT